MKKLKEILRLYRRRIYEFFGNPKYSKPSLNQLDDKLSKYLNFKNGFFIEVGANDGYAQSNTYYLEKILGWHGLLIEAIPELYEKCKKERKKSYVYNYALVEKDYLESTIKICYANLMSAVEGSKKLARVKNLENSYTVQVPAKTLDFVLEQLPHPVEINFLSLDVEGYEINVLKGLDLEKYKPTFILIETDHLQEFSRLLGYSYELVEQMSYHDYLFQRTK